jgi:hypothetical protein
MFSDEVLFTLRNILLVQMAVVSLAPEHALLVHQKIRKMGKSLRSSVSPKKPAQAGKGKSFWEIDMTKFEP